MFEEKCLKILFLCHLLTSRVFALLPSFQSQPLILFYFHAIIFSIIYNVLYFNSTKHLFVHFKSIQLLTTASKMSFVTLLEILNLTVIYIIQIWKMKDHLKLFQGLKYFFSELFKMGNFYRKIDFRKQLIIYAFSAYLLTGVRVYSIFIKFQQGFQEIYLDVIILFSMNFILSYVTNYVIGSMLVMDYFFQCINHQVYVIIQSTSKIEFLIRKSKRKLHLSMQYFCLLSDRLDQLAILHAQAIHLTRLLNRLIAPQLLSWTMWKICFTLFYLFLIFIKVKSNQITERQIFGKTFSIQLISNIIAVISDLTIFIIINYVYATVIREVGKIFVSKPYVIFVLNSFFAL